MVESPDANVSPAPRTVEHRRVRDAARVQRGLVASPAYSRVRACDGRADERAACGDPARPRDRLAAGTWGDGGSVVAVLVLVTGLASGDLPDVHLSESPEVPIGEELAPEMFPVVQVRGQLLESGVITLRRILPTHAVVIMDAGEP